MFLKILLFSIIFPYFYAFKWSEDRANSWYKTILDTNYMLLGSNFLPAYAINQLEMWQADTFNITRIDLELSWAENLGMNTVRVFLHDLVYQQDASGFKSRIDTFLGLCDKRGIKPMLVFFDSCWDPNPKPGKQHEPWPAVHNSGWAQSPAASALYDSTQYPRLETYVKDIIGMFANDTRILAWDMWNEPDNTGLGNYQEPANKTDYVNFLLPQTFQWARAANPTQPLTSGLHNSDYYHSGNLNPTEQIQVNNSDIITFHRYDPPSEFEANVKFLQKYNRPILCTEYMARPAGSQFSTILPLGRKYNIGMINWGFVNGKSQTSYPWDSWWNDYLTFPNWVWFHDIFRTDGTPYMLEEVNVIRRVKCPTGWYKSSSKNKCYKVFNMTMDWTNAEVMCRNNGGFVVSIDDAFENTDVTSYATQNAGTCGSKFYMGYVAKALFGQGSSTDWYWYNRDNGTYLNWKSGNPVNDQVSFCTVLNLDDGKWSNQNCDLQQCHICQIDLI